MSVLTEDNLEKVLRGGWTPFRPVMPREVRIFNDVIDPDFDYGNVRYKPLEVSTQFISRANYRFKCVAKTNEASELETWIAILELFQPQQGKPVLVSLQPWM